MKWSIEVEQNRLSLQAKVDGTKTKLSRNKLGQFATPSNLADEMIKFAKNNLSEGKKIRFFDPAFGSGSFYSSLLKNFDSSQIIESRGFEIDPDYGNPSKKFWETSNLKLSIADFVKAIPPKNKNHLSDLIVCNPPYVRHHHISAFIKRDLKEKIRERCGIQFSGLAGLYCYFLGLSHSWMAKDGLAGWLIPSEFMSVNYGKILKEYLLSKVTLIRIHRFDPHEVQFDDALVSSAVVFFRNKLPLTNHEIEFSFGGSLLKPKQIESITREEVQKETKWTRFPYRKKDKRKSILDLGDLFKIKRGLATGNNKFFILTKEQIREHKLNLFHFKPILPSPRYLKVTEIRSDSNGIPQIAPTFFLLDCKLDSLSVQRRYPSLWNYLEHGKIRVNEGFLCSNRTPWYKQEERQPAPFLFTYMGRFNGVQGKSFRFILNHSNATATNVYLMLYPKPVLETFIQKDKYLKKRIWHWLNKIQTKTLINEGRVYGGGLYKLEPKELSRVPAHGIFDLMNKSAAKEFKEIAAAKVFQFKKTSNSIKAG